MFQGRIRNNVWALCLANYETSMGVFNQGSLAGAKEYARISLLNVNDAGTELLFTG